MPYVRYASCVVTEPNMSNLEEDNYDDDDYGDGDNDDNDADNNYVGTVTRDEDDSDDSSVPIGAIIGIAVAGALLVIGVIVGVCWFVRKGRRSSAHPPQPTAQGPVLVSGVPGATCNLAFRSKRLADTPERTYCTRTETTAMLPSGCKFQG